MKNLQTFEEFLNEAKKSSNVITLKKFLRKDHNNLWKWMQKEFGLKYSPGLQRVAGPLTHGGDFTIDVSNWDEKDIEALKAYLKSQNHVFESFLNEDVDSTAYKTVVNILKDLHEFSNEIRFSTEDVNRVWNIVYDDPKGLTNDCLNKLRDRKLWNTDFAPSIGKFHGTRVNIGFDKSVQDYLDIENFDDKNWTVKPL
jgi:hypothetical protein